MAPALEPLLSRALGLKDPGRSDIYQMSIERVRSGRLITKGWKGPERGGDDRLEVGCHRAERPFHPGLNPPVELSRGRPPCPCLLLFRACSRRAAFQDSATPPLARPARVRPRPLLAPRPPRARIGPSARRAFCARRTFSPLRTLNFELTPPDHGARGLVPISTIGLPQPGQRGGGAGAWKPRGGSSFYYP